MDKFCWSTDWQQLLFIIEIFCTNIKMQHHLSSTWPVTNELDLQMWTDCRPKIAQCCGCSSVHRSLMKNADWLGLEIYGSMHLHCKMALWSDNWVMSVCDWGIKCASFSPILTFWHACIQWLVGLQLSIITYNDRIVASLPNNAYHRNCWQYRDKDMGLILHLSVMSGRQADTADNGLLGQWLVVIDTDWRIASQQHVRRYREWYEMLRYGN